MPSGAAMRQTAVTSTAPRSKRNSMAAPSEPPVASMGSRMKHCRFDSAIKLGKTRILPAILHGAWTMLVTGVILVGLQYPLGHDVDNVKIGVKLVILAAILVIALMNRKR